MEGENIRQGIKEPSGALRILPPALQGIIQAYPQSDSIEEIRLRAGQAPQLRMIGGEIAVAAPALTAAELRDVLARATRYSVHSYAQSLSGGFLTLMGGHRLGICGTATIEDGVLRGVRSLSSLNLRIARKMPALQPMARQLLAGVRGAVLVLSPPGLGKTTLLRAMIDELAGQGRTVSVADERSEIAALCEGVPQLLQAGAVDVLEGCPKAQAVMLLLKTMSPEWIVLDEITASEDIEAVRLCAYCGVRVLATAHAQTLSDLQKRPLYRELTKLHFFSHAVTISIENGARHYRLLPIGGT